jgi:hypothetical protein
MNKKIKKLLDRFTIELSDKPFAVRMAVDVGGGLVIKTFKGFMLIERYSNGGPQTLSGIKPGNYNMHVYKALDGLEALGEITEAENEDFVNWIRREEEKDRSKREIKNLMDTASKLGFECKPINGVKG